ncbi:hypothetical protein, partial [Pseudomonas syringae]|uniref:hypothetical protein n=1 Tax=Pseudomonas syringae TaxID=317 RepID=UPI001F08029A
IAVAPLCSEHLHPFSCSADRHDGVNLFTGHGKGIEDAETAENSRADLRLLCVDGGAGVRAWYFQHSAIARYS